MSKKQDDRNETPDTAVQPPLPQTQPQAQAAAEDRKVSKAQIWTFWGAVAAAVVIARVLDYAMPGVPESVTERWVMAGFAAFVAVFLYML